MKVRRIVLICQLLEGQQNLVCFDRRRGVLTAELRLTGGAVLFLLPWGYTGGAVCDFFLSSCHQVTLAQTLSLHSSHHVTAAKTLSLNSCHHVTAIFLAIACLFCNSCHHVTAIFLAIACLFCNSCHHVTAIFLARLSHRLVAEDACFRMKITLGVVLIRSLVCTECVPGHHRSGSGFALN